MTGITPDSIRAFSAQHDLRLEEEDVAGLLVGLPALLDGLAAIDPGDLGFGGPATSFDPDPGRDAGARRP
jgi:hypothetical protein